MRNVVPMITASSKKRTTKLALFFRIFATTSIILFYYFFASKLTSSTEPIYKHRSRNVLSVMNETYEIVELVTDSAKMTNTTTNIDNNNSTNENVTVQSRNCTEPAMLDFPPDGLTTEQRRDGLIFVHLLMACYCFWFLAIICDNYLIPVIELMCFSLNMTDDVIGATFMAAATSSPELFINSIGTFITHDDIGIGTVVGSAVFNVLAVPACCGLFARQRVSLDSWPISRDCFMYAIAVISLIAVLYDNLVMWYEALALVLAYFIYIFALYHNDVWASNVRHLKKKFQQKNKIKPYNEVTEILPLLSKDRKQDQIKNVRYLSTLDINGNHKSDTIDTPWNRSSETSYFAFICKWPIIFVLWLTIPDCRKHPKLKLLTLFVSILWIGAMSYFIAYLITIIGDTLSIPDTVMGLTLLAAGTSLPEAVSSVIVTNQGHGTMGISNSIGSNTFDILLCLGLPWFIKAYFLPDDPNNKWIELNSSGITYSAISLFSTLLGLYIAFCLNKFRLDWKIGLVCCLMYVLFLVFATLIELNIFFTVNLPMCSH